MTFPECGDQLDVTPDDNMLPRVSTRVPLWGLRVVLLSFIFWNVDRYKISAELPWSTNVLLTSRSFTFIVITMGSSWLGEIPRKSSSVKMIGGMDLWITELTVKTVADLSSLKCHFRAELEAPSPTNPPEMVLTTPLTWLFPPPRTEIFARGSLLCLYPPLLPLSDHSFGCYSSIYNSQGDLFELGLYILLYHVLDYGDINSTWTNQHFCMGVYDLGTRWSVLVWVPLS